MIGVIADDLTGAAEIGAIGLRHGLGVDILLMNGETHPALQNLSDESGEPSGSVNGDPTAPGNLICVDTDSRACDAQEAARRAASAAKTLHQAKARWIYKKVDSVLRGQVTAEVEAVLEALCYKRALLAPANPSLGRIIRGGRYWVHGKPIHRTEFARDPEHPRKSSQVLELLQPPEHFPIRVMSARGPLPDAGIIVGEAATPREVQRWASFRDNQTLPVGGADFFNASLRLDKRKVSVPTVEIRPAPSTGRELFICGTPSQAARQFLVTARQHKTPILTLPFELGWGAEFTPAAMAAIGRRALAAFQSHQRVILTTGLPLVRETAIAVRLSACVVQIAAFVLQQMKVERVYAEGGMTATELVRQMKWSRLSVIREIAPGVATLAVQGNLSQLLTIKPGSYAWPDP